MNELSGKYFLYIVFLLFIIGCDTREKSNNIFGPLEVVNHPEGINYVNPQSIKQSITYARGEYNRDQNIIARIYGPTARHGYGILIWQFCKANDSYLDIINQQDSFYDDHQEINEKILDEKFDLIKIGDSDAWGRRTTRNDASVYNLYINRPADVLAISLSSNDEAFDNYLKEFLVFVESIEISNSGTCA